MLVSAVTAAAAAVLAFMLIQRKLAAPAPAPVIAEPQASGEAAAQELAA